MATVVYAGECVIPNEQLIINNDTLFCEGSYFLPNGVLIEGNSLLVDCNGATFDGDFLHAGITVQGKNAQIQNCVLQNYDIGVLYID
ncbi:MAG: hypothetical protein Q7R33_06675, partial [Nitrosarchaeum sp.]|nr:hypothetical protein [Nitrosarchaeum sp.]